MRNFFILLSCLMLGYSNVSAAVDIFMHIPGRPGESQDQHHQNHIEVLSVTGKFNAKGCRNFTVTKLFDSASPLLIADAISGTTTNGVVIGYQKFTMEGPFDYFIYELDGVVVKSVSSSTSVVGGVEVPSESLRLQADTMAITYVPTTHDGTQGAPIKENISCVTAASMP